MTLPFIFIYRHHKWTIGTITTNNPISLHSQLTEITPIPCETFNGNPQCMFMADPFIVKDKEDYFIFYEHAPSTINNPGADIWVLQSNDLTNWKQLGPVLKEQFHTSFPNVFQIDGVWYMLPETGGSRQIRLYKAVDFPMKWKLDAVLLDNIHTADSIIINSGGIYYMLFLNITDFSLRLYYSDSLKDNWAEHPSSPIRTDKKDTRPGGTIGYIDDKLIYFIQDDSFGYGTGLIAYQIDKLSTTVFKDHKIDINPTLFRFGDGWASRGMHQLSWIKLDNGQYFCVVDGIADVQQKIGWSWRNLPRLRI